MNIKVTQTPEWTPECLSAVQVCAIEFGCNDTLGDTFQALAGWHIVVSGLGWRTTFHNGVVTDVRRSGVCDQPENSAETAEQRTTSSSSYYHVETVFRCFSGLCNDSDSFEDLDEAKDRMKDFVRDNGETAKCTVYHIVCNSNDPVMKAEFPSGDKIEAHYIGVVTSFRWAYVDDYCTNDDYDESGEYDDIDEVGEAEELHGRDLIGAKISYMNAV